MQAQKTQGQSVQPADQLKSGRMYWLGGGGGFASAKGVSLLGELGTCLPGSFEF